MPAEDSKTKKAYVAPGQAQKILSDIVVKAAPGALLQAVGDVDWAATPTA